MHFRLLAIILVSASMSCKPRLPNAGLSDMTLNQNQVVMSITDGILYIPAVMPEPIAYLTEPVTDKTADDKPISVPEAIKNLSARLKDEQKRIAEYSGSELDLALPTIEHMRAALISQLLFGIRSITNQQGRSISQEMVASASSMQLVSAEVILDQPGMWLDESDESEVYAALTEKTNVKKELFLAVKYSLNLKGFMPPKYDLSKPLVLRSFIPLSVAPSFRKEMFAAMKECIVPIGNATPDHYNFFEYLKTDHPKFATANAGEKFMRATNITIATTSNKANPNAAPEYNRIWEDDRLVVTYVFGRYGYQGAQAAADPGTLGFHKFLKDFRASTNITIEQEQKISDTNIRFRGKVKPGRHKGTRLIDVQVVHVPTIGTIKPEDVSTMFQDRLGPSDLFMYNGHSGYGNNIKHIENMVKPNPNQYVLFYLNGCSTYGYDNLSQNKNFDVIANGKMTDFYDMPKASIAAFEGLVAGSNYKQILQKLPQGGCPTVSGEDQPSVTK